MEKYKPRFTEGSPIKIKITGRRDGKVRGIVDADKWKQMIGIPKSSSRSLPDIVKDWNNSGEETMVEITL